MTEKIIDFVRELIGNDYITTALISMIPIVELRGAIPAAMTMGIHPLLALALAWAGSAIVSPILLLILRPVLNWMKKIKAFASLANAVESGFRAKALKVVGANADTELTPELAKKLEKKKMLGVYVFVAVPLPMTGVWTGSAISTFLDIPFWKSMFMVWLGNLTAGIIVTVLAVFLQDYMNIVLDVFLIIVIIVLLLYILRVVIKMVKSKKQAKEQAENSLSEDMQNDSENKNIVVDNESLDEDKNENIQDDIKNVTENTLIDDKMPTDDKDLSQKDGDIIVTSTSQNKSKRKDKVSDKKD